MSGKAVLDSLEKNVARIIGENRRLRSEVERLKVSKERLLDENRRLADKVADRERSLTIKELATGFAGDARDRKGIITARARVNRLMREVDKCIVLLNRD